METDSSKIKGDSQREGEMITSSLVNYGRVYYNYFKSIFGKKMFSDITIILDSEEIPSHQLILSVASPKFRQMIENAKKDQLKSSSNHLSLNIECESNQLSSFKHMLEFIYTGSISYLNETETLQVLKIAHEYKIQPLKNACGEQLADFSSGAESLGYLLDISQKYQCDSLKKRCGLFIAENFCDLLESHKVLSFEVDIWKGIVMSPKVKIQSEERLFETIELYTSQFNVERQSEIYDILLPYIHFSAMSVEYLVNKVESHPIICNKTVVKEALYQAYRNRVAHSKFTQVLPREYDSTDFSWNPSRCGGGISLSNFNSTAATTTAWNQVQTEQYLTVGNYFEVKIDQICQAQTNTYGIVVGLGPATVPLSGPGSIIGYHQVPGWGYIGNTGSIFPQSAIVARPQTPQTTGSNTFASGDIIKVALNKDYSITFYKNGQEVHSIQTGSTADVELYPTVAIASGQVTLI